MVVIKTVSEKYFSLNGVTLAKIYQPLKQGEFHVGIYNVNDTRHQLLESTKFDDIIVNGVTFDSLEETVSNLLDVVFNSDLSELLFEVSKKTDKGGYVGTTQDLKNELDAKSFEGILSYQTRNELYGVNPTPVNGTAAKVANDSNALYNGYYSVSNNVWVKDDDLYENEVDKSNTSKGVTGYGVYQHVKNKVSKKTGVNLFNINSENVVFGHYANFASGNIQENEIYNVTHPIEVEPNINYTLSYKHQIAWFDENGDYISGSNSNDLNKTQLSPEGAKYLRCSVLLSEWEEFQVVEGSVELEYTPYIENAESVSKESIIDGSVTEQKTIFFQKRLNLFNVYSEDVVLGHYVNYANGNIQVNAAYNVTHKIEVEANTNYTLSYKHQIAWFDENGDYISGSNSNDLNKTQLSPQGAKYLRCTVLLAEWEKFQVVKGSAELEYVPYIENAESVSEESIIDSSVTEKKTVFFQKRLNFFNVFSEEVVLGHYVNYANGNIQVNAAYNVTHKIEVEANTNYTLSYKHQIAWLDEYGVRVGGSDSNDLNKTQLSPQGAKYLRCTVLLEEWEEFQVVKGSAELEYTPYGYKIKDEYLDIKSKNSLQLESKLGQNGKRVTQVSLTDGNSITVTDFPRHLKKGLAMSISCNFTSFTGSVEFGKGIGDYRGDWLKIDNTNIYWQNYESTETTKATVPHSLNLDTFLKCSLFVDDNSVAHVVIYTLTDTFETTFDWVYEANHEPFLKTTGQDLTNVILNCTSKEFQHSVWAFGDSYFGVYENRWIGQLKELGYFNLLINGLAGQNSLNAYDDLVRALNFGTPKYLVWCLGMNDSDTNYINTLNNLIDLCENKGIELILATIPTVPTRDKEVISNAVVNSGYRFIDFYTAMGANSSGQWYSGYLNIDGVHPNTIGAKAQAMQFVIDLPEIMQYGKINSIGEIGNTSSDN